MDIWLIKICKRWVKYDLSNKILSFWFLMLSYNFIFLLFICVYIYIHIYCCMFAVLQLLRLLSIFTCWSSSRLVACRLWCAGGCWLLLLVAVAGCCCYSNCTSDPCLSALSLRLPHRSSRSVQQHDRGPQTELLILLATGNWQPDWPSTVARSLGRLF